jgi:small ligand-binding sensory domain FIST
VLQFQVRDATAARQELSSILGRRRPDPAAAALVFSCVGRGAPFFGEPGYDAQALLKKIGDTPMAGFLGNGEIGAIRGRPVVHQFAASYVVLREGGWN